MNQPPTDEEVAAAEALIERRREADRQAAVDRKRQVQAIFGDNYPDLIERLEALPADLRSDPNVIHHVEAIVRGLSGIATPVA